MFHIDGLKTLKEVLDNLESLFGKQDELRGHILENEPIALQFSKFDTSHLFFTKLKLVCMQCKKYMIENKDEQLVLSILSKLGSQFLVFASTFHSGRLSTPNW